MGPWISGVLWLVVGAEVQTKAIRVRHEGQQAEATRIAAALERAASRLPSFVGAQQLEIRARVTASTEELSRLTGLPFAAAAGVIDDEIIFAPASVTSRFEDLDQVALHEVAHLALLSHAGKRLPRWFIEGFAALLAGEGTQPLSLIGCSRPGQRLKLDAMILDRDADVRAAGYARSARLVREISRHAGSLEALWAALPEHATTKWLLAARFGPQTVSEVVREFSTCTALQGQ